MKHPAIKTAIAVLLLVCLVAALPARAAASEDIIYVSDLYYGYHTAYMSVPLGNYSIATTKIMADVYEDFINSPSFVWTKVSGSLSAVTSPKDMFQIVSDAFIDTEFTYNSALTAANEKLALGLLQATSNNDELTSTASAIVDRVNAMGDLLSVIYQDCDLENLTDIEAVNKLFDYMVNNNTMKALTSGQLEQVRTMILDDLQYIGNLTTAVTTVIDLMGGLYMSLVVEDSRLIMLDTILPLAKTGTTLHDGLSLLENQLSSGFASYFFQNYVVNEGLDLATTLGKNYLAGACPPAALAVGLIDLANTVIFDVIFDVPSVDDFMLQTVLTHYAIDLHTITREKLNVFEQAFSSADVVEFERLYAAFSAAVTAGLEATERLTLDENRAAFAEVNEQYGNYNYEAYVNDILADLYLIEPERRVMKEFTWKPTGSLKVERASNAVKEGYIYECQGAVRGDVYVNNGLTIDADETCVLGGNLYVTGGALKVYGSLHVKGDLEISSGWNMSNYEVARNNGTIRIDGDLSMTYSGNGSSHCSYFNNCGTVDVNGDVLLSGPRCYFSMEDANAVLRASGHLSAYAYTSWNKSYQGAIILDGDTQQQLRNLAVHDLTVENEAGVQYLSNVKLYGAFDSQDAPIDCNTYLLQVCASSVSLVGDGYDYGRIRVETAWTFSGDAVFDTLDTAAAFTVTEGSRCTVKGKLCHSAGRLAVNGSLHVMGDMEVPCGWGFSDYEAISNNGIVQIDGDLSMTYNGSGSSYSSYFNNRGTVDINGDISLIGPKCFFSMEDANAVLTVSGNLSAYSLTSWSKSYQGTIILDGDSQQQLRNLAVHDLTVENEEGIQYLSNVKLYGTFDSQDAPIDCNTYLLQICSSSAAFAGDGYDYGRIRVETPWTFSGDAVFDTLDTIDNFTVAEGSRCTVKGKLYHSKGQLVVNGSLHVMGDMEVPSGWGFSNYVAILNNGIVRIDGDLSMTYPNNGSSYSAYFNNYGTVEISGDLSLTGPRCFFSQKTAASELVLGGDCTAGAARLQTTAGTVRVLAAENTDAMIEAMVPVTTMTYDRAKAAYDDLSSFQKKYVTASIVLTDAEEKLTAKEKFSLLGSNMTLGNDLNLNFAAGVSALAEPHDCTAVITKMNNGQIEETLTIPAAQWRTMKSYYLIGFPLAAAQMCDEVYVEIFDEDGYALSINHRDSIRDYAMRMLENDAQPEIIKQVLVDMLNYGAAAQAYFGYNESEPANALLTGEQQALASEKPQYSNTQLPGSNFFGTNLSLVNNILLNFYFSGLDGKDPGSMYAQIRFTDTLGKQYDYSIPGDRWEPYGASGNICKIVVDKLVMSDANQAVTVLVYDENGDLFGSCSDSMASYIKRNENSAMAPVYDSIMRFSASAYNYMVSK